MNENRTIEDRVSAIEKDLSEKELNEKFSVFRGCWIDRIGDSARVLFHCELMELLSYVKSKA